MSRHNVWNSDQLQHYDTILLDCDGVLWHDTVPVPGAVETLSKLADAGKRLLYVTNNSSQSREQNMKKFQRLGFSHAISIESMWSSSFAVAKYIEASTDFNKEEDRIYIIGGEGIAIECQQLELQCVSSKSMFDRHYSIGELQNIPLDSSISVVIVGIDIELTYSKVSYAVSHLRQKEKKVKLIATNLDYNLPTPGHDLPGGGSCVAMVATAAEVKPVNVGKPEPFMLDLICERYGITDRSRICMVGDRLDTDILFGNKGGIDTIMVCTGINTREDVHHPTNTIHPTYILETINDLLK